MKLFTISTFVSGLLIFLVGYLITDYPTHVILAFASIVGLWIGVIVDWLFGKPSDGNGGDDSSWTGAC